MSNDPNYQFNAIDKTLRLILEELREQRNWLHAIALIVEATNTHSGSGCIMWARVAAGAETRGTDAPGKESR